MKLYRQYRDLFDQYKAEALAEREKIGLSLFDCQKMAYYLAFSDCISEAKDIEDIKDLFRILIMDGRKHG